MPCEHYKDALIEAAASGGVLADALASDSGMAALHAHLESCPSCRTAFAEEQSLFAAIDSGLHATANAEVPPSLLPRVRASVDEIAVASPLWSSRWFALVGAAAAAALFFAVVIDHNNPRTPPTNSAAFRPAVEQVNPTRQTPLSSTPSEASISVPRPQVSARDSAFFEEAASGTAMPEVLVPRDQETLLNNYAQQWASRKRAPLVVGGVVQTAMVRLEVAPIQIPELDVKPLAEGDSQ